MSALSEQTRDKAREKVERLTRVGPGKVDASGWREPMGMQANVQTGPRPISRRQFKRGGKVFGEVAKVNAGRAPRKSGGVASPWGNLDTKEENESREGPKHIGGMAKGGVPDAMVNRAMKAAARAGVDPQNSHPTYEKKFGEMADRKMRYNAEKQAKNPDKPIANAGGMKHGGSCTCAKCGGGRVNHAKGGSVTSGEQEGLRPKGGRIVRKSGGRTKKGTTVNVIIAPPQAAKPPMPMPPPGMPPPGGPPGMHQGMALPPGAGGPPPMVPPAGGMPPPPGLMRKSGGRAYPLEKGGGGGGLGRLAKVRAYG